MKRTNPTLFTMATEQNTPESLEAALERIAELENAAQDQEADRQIKRRGDWLSFVGPILIALVAIVQVVITQKFQAATNTFSDELERIKVEQNQLAKETKLAQDMFDNILDVDESTSNLALAIVAHNNPKLAVKLRSVVAADSALRDKFANNNSERLTQLLSYINHLVHPAKQTRWDAAETLLQFRDMPELPEQLLKFGMGTPEEGEGKTYGIPLRQYNVLVVLEDLAKLKTSTLKKSEKIDEFLNDLPTDEGRVREAIETINNFSSPEYPT